MMKTAIYAAILLAVCIARASSLKCYKCDNCLPSFLSIIENSEECGFLQTNCRKRISSNGDVSRACATVAECAGDLLGGLCTSPDQVNCAICCTSDNCNSAVGMTMSYVGLFLALATAVFSPYF